MLTSVSTRRRTPHRGARFAIWSSFRVVCFHAHPLTHTPHATTAAVSPPILPFSCRTPSSFLCRRFVTQTILAVPVFKPSGSGQRVVSCVLEALNQDSGRFDDRHVELLTSIATQVGAKLLEKLIFEDMKAKDDSGLGTEEIDLVRSVLLAEYADSASLRRPGVRLQSCTVPRTAVLRKYVFTSLPAHPESVTTATAVRSAVEYPTPATQTHPEHIIPRHSIHPP